MGCSGQLTASSGQSGDVKVLAGNAASSVGGSVVFQAGDSTATTGGSVDIAKSRRGWIFWWRSTGA